MTADKGTTVFHVSGRRNFTVHIAYAWGGLLVRKSTLQLPY